MQDDKHLPLPLVLVGVTAAVEACLCAVSLFNLSQSLLARPSNEPAAYVPLVIYLVLCGASLFTAVALLFRSTQSARTIAIAYLVLLLIFLGVQIVSIVLTSFELPIPTQTLTTWIGIRAGYAAWAIGLLLAVWRSARASATKRP